MAVSGMALFRMGDGSACSGSRGSLMADLDHVVFQVLDDVHGREQLAGDVGWAHVGAATADSTGVSVEELLPGEVLHPRRAEPLGVLQVHGWQRPPRVQGAEEGIDGRGHHVHVLGEGDINREEQDNGEVNPPEQSLKDAGGGLTDAPVNEQPSQRSADENVGLRPGAALGNVEAVGQ